MRLLFTGVGRRVELIQAFRKAAATLKIDIIIFGTDIDETAPAIFFCDHYRRTVSMRDKRYIDNLLNICKLDKIDLIVPTIDTDLIALSENISFFYDVGTKVLISSVDVIYTCRDKNKTISFFKSCGLDSMKTFNNWKDYDCGYPAIIKPKDGSGSVNVYYVEDVKELEFYANQCKDYIVQPYINGIEYSIDIMCNWVGKPVSIIPRERVSVRAGEVIKTQISMDPIMIDEAKKICASLKPIGPITVQLIRDTAGADRFIEINPRYGGGAPLSMKAGSKSAETALRMIDNDDFEYNDSSIIDGALYSRFDQSICVTSGRNTIKGVIFDLDDTLFSEMDYVRSGFKAVSDYLGGGFEAKLFEYFHDKKNAIDELLREIGMLDKLDEVLNVYRMHKPEIYLYDGVIEKINEIRDNGIKVGIITDGRPEGQHNKLEALGLSVDDSIVTDELGGVQFRKPCDIAFRIMMTRWYLNPEDVVYIGNDPSKDSLVAQQMGISFIPVNNRDGLHEGFENGMPINTVLDDILSKVK